MSDQRIIVAVRIRPTIGKEKYEPVCARKADDGQTIMIKPEDDNAAYLNNNQTLAFQFDFVFDADDEQQAVYEEGVQELVDHTLSGFNSTVFTYGQTGSGKTFTILGNVQDIVANHNRALKERKAHATNDIHIPLTSGAGMFLRVFEDLFNYKAAMRGKVHIMIALSALELYVEDVMDLLSKNKKKLKLRETPEETITMGITLVEVHNMMDVIENFEIANSFRSVTATKMNDTSSRSHAIFFIDVFQIPREITENGATRLNPSFERPPTLPSLLDENSNLVMNSPTTMGVQGLVRSRMALVDLAGSERVKKSGVTGQGMTEAQAINKSLSTLGTVINAMYTQQQHIPFRESKLTKLLKHSLVDTRSKLLLIGQVAPPTASAQESLGTLRFCDRVKGLKAGQVLGFSNPQDEENYLLSVKRNEELVAEMRILHAEYDFQPIGVRRLAQAQRVPLEAVRQQAVLQLCEPPTPAERIQARELERLRAAEAAEVQRRDLAVEEFVLEMNTLIEEYEQIAAAAKQAKKQAKKEREQLDAGHEELVHQAKKAKKRRVKLDEAVKERKLQLAHLREEEQALAEEIRRVREAKVEIGADDLRGLGGVGTGGIKPLNPLMTGPTEEAIHLLLENFHSHALEQNGLYNLYVMRLAATRKQRSQVRRMKLMSSDLVTQGTLLFDLLEFLIERAVDISEGRVTANSKWSWHDVDGLSRQLLEAQQMYPPLLLSESQLTPTYHSQACLPVPETFHTHTFLSSDESDDENSHHAAESRRPRRKGKGSVSLQEGGLESYSDADDEESPRTTSHRMKADWMKGELERDRQEAAGRAVGRDADPDARERPDGDSPRHKHKKKKTPLITPEGEGTPEGPSSPAAQDASTTPKKKRKRRKSKAGEDDDGGEARESKTKNPTPKPQKDPPKTTNWAPQK
ncbi:kinesin [Strigomonas culicis]|uniref:Kinesin-like protein n=1 Tax=Strigomonas culicis TaxID=28005 RepID=S9U224_9TRYP|nr:kinesin [Strigomonas culicis]|eukprot:EPY22988.1 kinesin [Strigomonas culicis]